jgi:hypothetical protein
MKYTIIENPTYTSHSVGIYIEPDNRVLRLFMGSIAISTLPKLVLSLLKSIGFGDENCSLKFFHELDWEDIEELGSEMKETDLCLYLYDGNSNQAIVDKHVFVHIVFDYLQKVIEKGKVEKILSDAIINELSTSLDQLKEIIKTHSN